MSYFVYAMAHDAGEFLCGPVKIGITGNPDARLASIQTGSPKKLALGFVVDLRVKESARQIEQAVHRHLAEKSLEGEWFDIDLIKAATVIGWHVEHHLMVGFGREGWTLNQLKQELYECGVARIRNKLAAEKYINAWLEQAA